MDSTRRRPDTAATPFEDGCRTAFATCRVQNLVKQIAVPENAHVQVGIRARHGIAVGVDDLVARQSDDTRRDATALTARHFIGEIACQSAAIVTTVGLAVVHIACSGIPIAIALRTFLTSKLLQSPAIGIEVAHMLCITVSQSSSAESHAVVVDNH